MSMLERLSDARGTLEGKIVAVILAVLLVLPVASVTAFAGGHDHESDATGNTEEVQTVSEELPDTGSVVLDEAPAPEEEVPEVADPEPGTPTPEDPTEPEAPGVPAAPEPEDPPAATPTEEPTETEEPEATTVEVQLKIDEGATLKFEDDTFYTEDDTKMELTSDQEKEFTIEVDEGYELAVEKPVVFKDVDDIEEELEAVDGKYTFPTNVMDGGKLFIAANVALAGAPEEDAIDDANNASNADNGVAAAMLDDWVYPSATQVLHPEAWCTNVPLGTNSFDTAKYPALGSRDGLAPENFAKNEIKKGEKVYQFRHAQVLAKGNHQTEASDCSRYDSSKAVKAFRYNESAAQWQYTYDGASWSSIEGLQLVFYYRYHQPLGSDGDVKLQSKDWPYPESDWLRGKDYKNEKINASNPAVVVYQLYDSKGNKLSSQQVRAYYYSPKIDREDNSLKISEYWEISDVRIVPLEGKPVLKTAFSYDAPASFAAVGSMPGAIKASNPALFSIPWASAWGQAKNACLVAAKIKAYPSTEALTVNYRDNLDGKIKKTDSVFAKKPDGQPKPTWDEYVSLDGENKAVAKDGHAIDGQPNSLGVTVPMDLAGATYPFSFEFIHEGYDKNQVRAEKNGNVLNLYFNRIYNVSYEWSGLDETGVKIFRDQDGNQTWELPGTSTVVVNHEVDVDSSHNAGDLAYALNDDKQVLAIYKFSGWKLDGQGDVVTGKITVNSDKHFAGVWTRLDTAFSGTVDITGGKYDGTDAYTESLWSSLENTLSKVTMNEDASYEYFVAAAKDENGKVTEWKPLENAPVNAGSYKVVATWPQTAEHLIVKAEKPFEITKRSIAITGVSGTWPFDGKEHSTVDKNGAYNAEGAVASLAGDGFVANEGINVEYSAKILAGDRIMNPFTYRFWENTLKENYDISTTAGVLEITPRDDEAKTHIVMTAKSVADPITYDGNGHDFSGLTSIAGSDITNGVVSLDSKTAMFTYEGNVYTISNFTTTGERNAKDANLPLLNTENQYDTYKNDVVAIAPENGEASQAKIKITLGDVSGTDVTNQFIIDKVQGTAQILPRPVVLQAQNASKVYDGSNFVLSDEQKVVTNKMGEPFDSVLDSDAVVTSSLDGMEYKNVATYTGAIVVNETSIVSKKDDNGADLYKQTNYVLQFNPGTLTITPQSITKDPQNPDAYKGVEVGDLADEQYNGTKWEKTPEVTPAANSVNETITFDVARTNDLTNVGTKTVTITGKGNYMGTVTRTFDVTPAPVVIMVDSYSKVYGQDDPTFTGTAGVPRKGDDGNWKRTEEGAYEVDSLFKNDRNNNKEDSAGNFTYVRSNADVQNVGTYKNVLTTSFDAANADAVKTAINANYSLVEVIPGNFSITQATATLNATGVTTTYDANEYAISIAPMGEEGWTVEYATTPNGPWGENPVYTEAGQYPVYVKATNPNYVDVYGTATVTINPAPVTIRVNDATKVAGSENPEFTGAIEGEVAGHELTGVSYYRKSDAEGIGTYENDLTASFDDNPNYTITVEDGDFTITAMPVPAEPVTPPTTPAPGPLDGIVTTVTDFLATPIIGAPAVADTTAIDDAENPLAQIEDDGTPMSAFDAPICWIHYYILLGIIITAIYGGGVIARRLGYSHKVKSYEDDVTGKEKKRDKVKDPAPNPAQPTI